MKYFKNKNLSGFSLVETLLYVALTLVLIGAISSFVTVILNFKAKTYAISEVEQTGNQIVLLITRSVRNGVAINSPATGASASTLSINTITAGDNPTLFQLSGTTLQMKEGAANAFNLTPTTISVTSITFTNVASSGTNGTIRLQMTLSFYNPTNRQENNYSQTFYGTADIRL